MIKKVLSGKKAYEVESIENVINSKAEHDIDRLTKREKEVLRELSRGLNNKDIASNLKEKITQATREELLEVEFAFIDIHEDILNDLKIVDYIKLKNKELKVVVLDSYKNNIFLKTSLKYGIE